VIATAEEPSPPGGVVEIAPVVIERIAGAAAGEVPRIVAATPSVVGRVLGRAPRATPSYERPAGQPSRLALDVTIDYPADVLALAGQVRAHVAERITELTGRQVDRIDVTVAGFTLPGPEPRVL
jgi:uncharacterized alkaline shock family protein YloU